MEAVYDISIFKGELDLINDPKIRELTEEALLNAPKYIWYVPSSITGKHHPPDDNHPGGLIWHLKKTAWVAYRMFDNLLLNTDIGIVAGVLHDICHRGVNDEPEEGYDSYQKHGELALTVMSKVTVLVANTETWGGTWATIMQCVLSHMGRWGDVKPESVEQTTFHLADVAASTKGLVSVGYLSASTVGDEGYSISEIVGKKEYFKEVDGDLVFNFGKMQDVPLKTVANGNDGYLGWIIRQGITSNDNPKGFPEEVINQVKDARKQLLDERRERNKLAQGSLFDMAGRESNELS